MADGVRKLVTVSFLAALLAVLSGCAPSRPPSAKEQESVASGKRAVVLLRVTCDINGKPFEPFGRAVMDDNVGVALGGFETGGKVRQVFPSFLSKETRRDGWIYFLLDPGLHYLAFLPPRRTDMISYAAMFNSAPLWRIEVPSASQTVYAGTLHLPAKKLNLLFGETASAFFYDRITITNEEDLAREITATFFPHFSAPDISLIQRHEGPIILKSPHATHN